MRLLTLTQPWATLVAIGAKRIETRSWTTSYRGPLAVHAAKGLNGLYKGADEQALRDMWAVEPFGAVLDAAGYHDGHHLPRGAIVAVADLVDVVRVPDGALAVAAHGAEHECDFGNYGPGRYAWLLDNLQRLTVSYPVRGERGLPSLAPDVARVIREVEKTT